MSFGFKKKHSAKTQSETKEKEIVDIMNAADDATSDNDYAKDDNGNSGNKY